MPQPIPLANERRVGEPTLSGRKSLRTPSTSLRVYANRPRALANSIRELAYLSRTDRESLRTCSRTVANPQEQRISRISRIARVLATPRDANPHIGRELSRTCRKSVIRESSRILACCESARVWRIRSRILRESESLRVPRISAHGTGYMSHI